MEKKVFYLQRAACNVSVRFSKTSCFLFQVITIAERVIRQGHQL
jgi:hypothetical protein